MERRRSSTRHSVPPYYWQIIGLAVRVPVWGLYRDKYRRDGDFGVRMDVAGDERKIFGRQHLDYAKVQNIRRVYDQMIKRRRMKC